MTNTDGKTPAQFLKEATLEDHDSIEGAVPVMSPGFSPAEYKKLLMKFYGFYRSMESSLAAAIKNLEFDYSERQKLPLLVSDLQYLGFTQSDLEKIPRFMPWFENLKPAELLGILYVIEGSTLGGQVISRHLQKQYGYSPAQGAAYFSSYRERLGMMWKGFQEILNRELKTESDILLATEAAKQTFRQLGAWLKSTGTAPLLH